MRSKQLFAALACAAAALGAHATDVALPVGSGDAGYGVWNPFVVDDFVAPSYGLGWIDDSDGSDLSFTFTIAAGSVGHLVVVDGGFAGDTYSVTNFGSVLGATSAVPAGTYEASPNVGYDFDAALADPAFSHGDFRLAAGEYRISGSLLQSVTAGGVPLDATVGAVQLTVSAVPEPATWLSLAAGLLALATVVRRGGAR
jgi:hypothetical protein